MRRLRVQRANDNRGLKTHFLAPVTTFLSTSIDRHSLAMLELDRDYVNNICQINMLSKRPIQALGEVGLQVLLILQTDRQAHRPLPHQ
jgi:hypothetical protein